MFDETLYRKTMDELCAPDALRGKIMEMTKGEKQTRMVHSAARRLIVAATVVALLATSALALSPTLRERVRAALGGYASYAQEFEDTMQTVNGFEVRVVSAVADHSLLKAYLEVRDTTGRRLTEAVQADGHFLREFDENLGVLFTTGACRQIEFDEAAQTALLEVEQWGGWFYADQDVALLCWLRPEGYETDWKEEFRFPLTVDYLPVRTIDLSGATDGTELPPLDRLELSAQSASLFTQSGEESEQWFAYADSFRANATLYFADGSQRVSDEYAPGASRFIAAGQWRFDGGEPIDEGEVIGFSWRDWYIPLGGDHAGAIRQR